MQAFKDIVGATALVVVAIVGLGVLFAGVEMWLWNQVMPQVFGLTVLTFWQALCISWLSMMLFKSMPTPSNKGEEQLKEIVGQQRRQEDALYQIVGAQERQIEALSEIRDSLRDIGLTLEQRP